MTKKLSQSTIRRANIAIKKGEIFKPSVLQVLEENGHGAEAYKFINWVMRRGDG